MSDPVIPTPATNGTAQGGPNGTPPVQTPAPAQPASDQQMIARGADVASHSMPAVIPGATPMPTQAPNAPNAAQPQPGQPTQPTQTPHEALYSKILRTLSPGTKYLDPQGNQQTTRPSLSNSILAGAVAGLLQPTAFRQGSFGPIADMQQTNFNAFQAGQAKSKEQSDAVQKLSDDAQARKLNYVKSNVDAMHNYASLMQAQATAEKEGAEAEKAQTSNWQDIINQNQTTLLKDADDFDSNRPTPDAPKARIASGMTMKELLASPFKDKMTSQLMVQDGLTQEMDPTTGKSHTVPTFTVLNPDVQLKMNKDAVDRAAKINPQFAGLYEATGGTVRMNLGRYTALTHQINSVDHAEDLLQSVADSKDPDLMALGIKGDVEGRLASAVRGNSAAMKSLMEFENATAHGGTTADQLNRLLTSDGGDAIFKALGTDRDAVQDYVDTIYNRRLKNQTLAREGADKAPASPTRIAGFADAVAKLPKEYQGPLYDNLGMDVNGNPTRIPTNKDLDGMDNKIIDIQKTVDKAALEAATPEAIANQVQLSIGAGDLTRARDLYSMRKDTKAAYNTGLENKAISLGLNPSHFNIEALNQKSKTQEDYQPNGKIGQNLTAFRAFIEHGLDAKVANDAWQRSGSPDLNKSIKWWDEHAANDQNFQRFRASIIAPAQEYMNFLKANHATTVGDEAALNAILKDNATPQTIYTALQTFTRTADDRLLSLGQGYVNSVGTTNPGLLTKTAIDSMKALGVDSRAKDVAGELPRAQSWVSNLQFQTLNTKNPQDLAVATQFLNAASGDKDLARSMAKEHGYSF